MAADSDVTASGLRLDQGRRAMRALRIVCRACGTMLLADTSVLDRVPRSTQQPTRILCPRCGTMRVENL